MERTDDLTDLSACELLAGYAARAFSPIEVVDAVFGRIETAHTQGRSPVR
jgi:hypothetical protein